MPVTRFAPSPTGYLHFGHAYSAFTARHSCAGGRFLLRIEDIDPTRCKPEYASAIFEDLKWLGFEWEEPVRFQSQHMADYAAALTKLKDMGLVYPCFCTRAEIAREAARAGGAPHEEDGTIVYPGTCRGISASKREADVERLSVTSWRLDVAKAMNLTGPLYWYEHDRGKIEAKPDIFGDVVLARKDVPTSYHLSVTVDDAIQGISIVTRGEDLFKSTNIHRLLQALLGYDPPEYRHHKLLADSTGRRFAKRDGAVTLRSLRANGNKPQDILASFLLE